MANLRLARTGGYRFRTIKSGLYTGRTRHYHFGITLPGQQRRFTTQLFFAGEPGNARDGVLGGIRDEAQRASVIREFTPVPDTPELVTTWDIVMGLTPGDDEARSSSRTRHRITQASATARLVAQATFAACAVRRWLAGAAQPRPFLWAISAARAA